ncbi:MAG: DUF4373 domain-containing protein [Odoribacter sp.]|nr:DUF4373 domain-containing protein [Odoribacter sp.]
MKTTKITINQAFFENDAIVMLIDRHGHESVGILLHLFTLMAAGDYSLSYNQADVIRLRHKLFGIDIEILSQIIETCVELGILNLNDYVEHKRLTSQYVQHTCKKSTKHNAISAQHAGDKHESNDKPSNPVTRITETPAATSCRDSTCCATASNYEQTHKPGEATPSPTPPRELTFIYRPPSAPDTNGKYKQ